MKVLIAIFTVLAMIGSAYAAPVDCTQKKNAGKLECKPAPKSDVKVEVKKPPKVDRKAPAATQKKAEEKKDKK